MKGHSMDWEAAAASAHRMDAEDELARFRNEFALRPGEVYLDGNSLGLLSKRAEESLLRVVNEWKAQGIGGWMAGEPPWFHLAERVGAQMAALLGAEPKAVVAANSTTVNLHQLLATLFRPEGARTRILVDALAFPSDRYALQSHLRLRGRDSDAHLVTVVSSDGLTLDEDTIIAAMTPDMQMAVLPAVVYTSGQLLDMARLTEAAHRRGLLIGFDCSHSVGAVPHALDAWGVDFAFWCSYKYLNGGPGAVGGLYLNRRHWGTASGMAGWWGSHKERQFDMAPDMETAEGAGALQVGTPNILSLSPLQGALEMIAEAGIERLRRKSLALTDFLMTLADVELQTYGFMVGTPREAHRRGGHVALRHPEAARICKALHKAGVIPDFRPPDIVRLAPVALYTCFADVLEAIRRLKGIMGDQTYTHYEQGRNLVA